jgi:hypothetical protein
MLVKSPKLPHFTIECKVNHFINNGINEYQLRKEEKRLGQQRQKKK